MQDARIRTALLIICLACLGGSGYVLLRGRQTSLPPIVVAAPPPAANPDTAAPATLSKPTRRLYVDVAGAVRRPSLYLLPPNSRVMQAIYAAGGPTATADMDAVNLAQPVTDGEKVFVPEHVAAVSTAASAPVPVPVNGAPTVIRLNGSSVKADKGHGGRTNKISIDTGEQVGLNSATLDQLERLPGVGPSMAARILAYRQQAGGFGKIEDLTLVTGIGPKKYAKLEPFVTLN